MNKIILAYSRENADLAAAIEQPLGRLGIPFEHVTDQAVSQPGDFSVALRTAEDPVLLLVTDNWLKNVHCMSGALELVQTLNRQQRLLAVVANGTSADGAVVETRIDRMVNAIQYTNHWQSIFLDLSGQQSHIPEEERLRFDANLAVIRDISNEIFDLISALRESDCITWNQLLAEDFAVFFQKFGLQEWHDQYRRLAAPAPPVPEEKPAQAPVLSGPLAPKPADDEPLNWPDEAAPEQKTPAPTTDFEHIEALLNEMPDATEEVSAEQAPEPSPTAPNMEDDVSQTIRDAWFWLENGHIERGIQVFQLALEEHPNHPELRAQYDSALTKFDRQEAQDNPPEAGTTIATPDISEAKSFDQIGEEAVAKGDFLFAKFCWDRVAELSPNYPGIFRKLGLLTSEHLRDYRETAIHYLDKALESDPDDQEVRERLAALLSPPAAEPAVILETIRTEDPAAPVSEPEEPVAEHPGSPEPASEEPEAGSQSEEEPGTAAQPTMPQDKLTVLITGATSGIGLATARLFAQNGHRLILVGRRADRLETVKNEFIESFHSDVLTLSFDVRNFETVQQHLTHLPEGWQNVDVLLNNAGLAKGLSPIHEGELDHWETMIDTNVKGLLYVSRCIAPQMVRRKHGHIINIGSSAGKEVYPNGNVYCATKFAVDALTRAMRMDLFTHNIRVSQVSPGHVEETEFALNRFDGDAEKAKIYKDFQPLKASDVAEVIYFMATRPAHVNIQDVWMFGTQQASAGMIDRSGR